MYHGTKHFFYCQDKFSRILSAYIYFRIQHILTKKMFLQNIQTNCATIITEKWVIL